MIGDVILGPCVLPNRLSGDSYIAFLQDVLPVQLENVPLATHRGMWLMHDGAPPHNTGNVTEYLCNVFQRRVIANNGPIKWPPRSPDLTPLDFFLWGQLKTLVYSTPIRGPEDLLMRIRNGCDVIRNTPGLIARVRESIIRRYELCVEVGGSHIEHLL